MTLPRIGIAGLGVVGAELVRMLQRAPEPPVTITAVSARNRARDRGVSLDAYDWEDDAVALAAREDVDIFVELMGGADGPALASVETALRRGADVVTANKALLAIHGQSLAGLAEDHGARLFYEAAVCGGMPAIRSVRDNAGLSQISRVSGILNGTCNYILSEMARTGAAYDAALTDAQTLGYAEADPTLDVNGTDAAHKLAILATIAFDVAVPFDEVRIEGIEAIGAGDIAAADTLGYVIRLLGVADRSEAGISLGVAPVLVEKGTTLANAEGPGNCLVIDSSPQGTITIAGPGAGAGPTASTVAADLLALARGAGGPVFNTPAARLARPDFLTADAAERPYYLRIKLRDVAGAVASITETLAGRGVSIDTLLQPSASRTATERHDGTEAELVVITHGATGARIADISRDIAAMPFTIAAPSTIPLFV